MPLGDFRSVFLPYCLQRQPDGRYAVLNREYKPCGFLTREHVEYAKYPILVRFKRLTPAMARRISCRGSEDLDAIHLYHDGCIPTRSATNMAEYQARLALLAPLKVTVGEERKSRARAGQARKRG